MKYLLGASALAGLMVLSAPSYAQFGGGGGGAVTGTGDAAAQNLPSTVGIGNQTGNGYYYGERPYAGTRYNGRSIYRAPVPPGRPFYPY